MGSTEVQIKTAYEVNGMSPAEIAEDQSLDVIAVKAKLMQISSKYRKDCGHEPSNDDALNFSDYDLSKVNEVILETALSATHPDGKIDYRTRLAAATYIRDDKKGRKEVKQVMQNTQFNIFDINASLNQMRQGADKIKAAISTNGKQKAIEA